MTRPRRSIFTALLAWFLFWLQAWAWPLGPGRDCYSYFYYVYDFGAAHPEHWFTMLFRTPLAPFFNVFLIDGLGPRLAEILMSFLYAGTLGLAHFQISQWGKKAADIFIGALLLHFAYASLFHVVSNDPLVSILFAWIVIATLWTSALPQKRRFYILGFLAGLMSLTRPGILNAVGLIAFLLPQISFQKKIRFFAIFLLGLLPFTLGWSMYNLKHYGVFKSSIGTEAFLPMGRLLATDKLVELENGPATRELGRMVSEYLLILPENLGLSVNDFFKTKAHYSDFILLIDRENPGIYDYRLISKAGWEAVRKHFPQYAGGVAKTFFLTFLGNLKHPVPLTNGSFVFTHRNYVAFQKDQKDTTVSLDEIDPHTIRRDPKTEENFRRIGPQHLHSYYTQSRLPARDGNIVWGRLLNWGAYLFPPLLIWILAGAYGLFRKRQLVITSQTLRAITWLWLLGLLTNFAACLGIWVAVYEYRLPFDFVFVLLPILLAFWKPNAYTAS